MDKCQGFQVEAAYNGKEALEVIRTNPPDLAVLDLNTPFMTGFEISDVGGKGWFFEAGQLAGRSPVFPAGSVGGKGINVYASELPWG